MRKRVVAFLAAILVIFSLGAIPASAAEYRWASIHSVTPVILAQDKMYMCTVMAMNDATQITGTLVLYEKTTGGYREVSRMQEIVHGTSAAFKKSYSFSKGKTYKLVATITVLRNGVLETTTQSTESRV